MESIEDILAAIFRMDRRSPEDVVQRMLEIAQQIDQHHMYPPEAADEAVAKIVADLKARGYTAEQVRPLEMYARSREGALPQPKPFGHSDA